MTVEKNLFRLLLDYDFYTANKQSILKSMFPDNLRQIYDLVIRSHEKFKKPLSIQEIKGLFSVEYPTATKAAKDALFMLLDDLPSEIGSDVAQEILRKAWIIERGRQLAELSIEIANGKEADLKKAAEIIKDLESGRMDDGRDLTPISSEIEDILREVEVTQKWSYNLTNLQKVVPGIGPGIFKAAFGRVESGKSAYWISLSAGPNGFSHQGAKVFAYCNEEAAQRSQARAVMSCSGFAIGEIKENRELAANRYSTIKDNLKFFDVRGFTIYEIEKHIEKHKPDIFIVDQLDKVQINGSFAREDERLGALYIYTRDICAKYETAGIAISQANADSEGKAYLGTANMALARTAKAAELDILIGIGKSPLHQDTGRVLNVVKNKLSGRHDDVICNIIPEISRYVD